MVMRLHCQVNLLCWKLGVQWNGKPLQLARRHRISREQLPVLMVGAGLPAAALADEVVFTVPRFEAYLRRRFVGARDAAGQEP